MSQLILVYCFVFLCVCGVLVWVTGQAADPEDRTVGWHARRWFLVVWLALVWPSTALVGVVYLHPVGRRYVLRFIGRQE